MCQASVHHIDVKNVFYVFLFYIKKCVFNVFIFLTFFIIKKTVGQKGYIYYL